MVFKYPAFVEAYGDEYMVRFHDLPEIFSSGFDEEDAIFKATEALTGTLMDCIHGGRDIPYPTENIEGAVYIAPSSIMQSILHMRFGSGSPAHESKSSKSKHLSDEA